jgi:DNA-binding NarL/FixJ family response regulator
MGVVEELVRARDAYDRHDWLSAYEGLSEAGPDSLSAPDFVRLATVAFLLGHNNDCVQAMQRAHRLHLDAGDLVAAARCGLWLAMVLELAGEPAVAGGWVSRSESLLDRVDEDVVERGYLLIDRMYGHVFSGRMDEALPLADEAEGYGRRFADPDLSALAVSSVGRILMHTGRVPEGLARLDESMTGIVAGEVGPLVAGAVYCSMIEACQEVADFDRAAEWTTVLTRWCEDQPGLVPFTGQCAVHRGQIMRLRGAYDAALDEYDRALVRYDLAGATAAVGLVWAERGEVLRIRGDLTGAEAAFEQAVAHGHEPQPGLALLWLAQGRAPAATAVVERLLSEAVADPVARARLLPAAAEILLATGAVDRAAETAEDLAVLAADFRCPGLRAAADHALGSALLAGGDLAEAVPHLRRAARLWARMEAPLETARARAALGQTFRGLGDEASAVAELTAARRILAGIGAHSAEGEVAALIAPAVPAGLTAREVEVLRLVAAGRSNPEIASDLVLSEKTVARHLSNIFAKLDVRSRTAAAAFAYEHHLV